MDYTIDIVELFLVGTSSIADRKNVIKANMSEKSRVSSRLIVDISTLSRWIGPPVGITRTERELALWARSHRRDAVLAIYDSTRRSMRIIQPEWLDAMLAGDAIINAYDLAGPVYRRRSRTERIPAIIRPAARWLLQTKRQLLFTLEKIRLTTKNPRRAAFIDRLQRRLMSKRYRQMMIRPDGSRRALVPYSLAAGPDLVLRPTDTVLFAGSGWSNTDILAIRVLKEQARFRFVVLCYDILPLQFPQFYKTHDIDAFREYYRVAFPMADLVVCTSRRIEADIRAYCAANGLAIGTTHVTPLGADATRFMTSLVSTLPEGIESGHYALFVSTLEPRKGHRLLYRVWIRLLEAGIPQAMRFKLVFVGRQGWMVDNLMHDLKSNPILGDTLQVLSDVDDAQLATLYDGAAFCLFPSIYEGYGLPVVESFLHGKAVIASTGGAIPEVVGEFSPCLDPENEDLWYGTLKKWIEDPGARRPFEIAIRERFRHPSWKEAAAQFFAILDEHEATSETSRDFQPPCGHFIK